MSARRFTAVIAGVIFLASACGEPQQDIRVMRRSIARTEAVPHVLRYTETADGRTVEAVVRVEDSFRSAVTLSLEGTPVFEERLIDDAVAVRLLAPDKWNPAAGTPLESILGSGRWVVDPAGAPPVLFSESERKPITDVGTDEVFDAENALDYARTVAESARGVVRFNKDSIQYRPSEDPFRDLVDRDDKAGIIRYDAIPPPLPRSEEQTRGQFVLPDARYFRKLAVYVNEGRVVRVLERIDFEGHEELVKAKQRNRPRFLLRVLRGLRQGLGDDPIRPREMSIEVLSAGRSMSIALPSDATTANLGSLLEENALAELPDPAKLKAKPEA